MADEDLSDEQLRQLLRDAEQRLRNEGSRQLQLSPTVQLNIPKVASINHIQSYITKTTHGAQVDPSRLLKPHERQLASGIRHVEDPIVAKAQAAKVKKSTAGSDWFDLPRTNLTPELKRDLQLLRMRDVLDPHRHYKKEGKRPAIPEYSQVGTIIEGPTEYFNGRLSNKERKRTFVEEVLAGEHATGRFKSKYNEIQVAKTSGRKVHYKKIKAMRRGGVSKG